MCLCFPAASAVIPDRSQIFKQQLTDTKYPTAAAVQVPVFGAAAPAAKNAQFTTEVPQKLIGFVNLANFGFLLSSISRQNCEDFGHFFGVGNNATIQVSLGIKIFFPGIKRAAAVVLQIPDDVDHSYRKQTAPNDNS